MGNKDYFLDLLEFVVEMDWFLCQITTTIEFLSLQLKANINGRSEARDAMKGSCIYHTVSPISMVCCMCLTVETIEFKSSRKRASSFELLGGKAYPQDSSHILEALRSEMGLPMSQIAITTGFNIFQSIPK